MLATIVLVGVCGYGTLLMVQDERNGMNAAKTGGANSSANASHLRDITSQAVDPAPLTEQEVFPAATITPDPAQPPYTVVKTQASTDCKTAAAGDIATMLTGLGCTQVVRATMKSPTGAYVLTAGLFNLRDENAATQAHDSIKNTVDAQKGRFTGFAVGNGLDAIARSATQAGWNTLGHYLAYCVIARVDGKAIEAADDANLQHLINDIVQTYLLQTVVGKRAGAVPTGAPSAAH